MISFMLNRILLSKPDLHCVLPWKNTEKGYPFSTLPMGLLSGRLGSGPLKITGF